MTLAQFSLLAVFLMLGTWQYRADSASLEDIQSAAVGSNDEGRVSTLSKIPHKVKQPQFCIVLALCATTQSLIIL
jgi:hypothetical protein